MSIDRGRDAALFDVGIAASALLLVAMGCLIFAISVLFSVVFSLCAQTGGYAGWFFGIVTALIATVVLAGCFEVARACVGRLSGFGQGLEDES